VVKKKAKSSKGLTVKTFKGLNKKRMESRGTGGKRVIMRKGDTIVVQFLQEPPEFLEFEQHVWQEDNQWHYVPCADDGCPLCEHEDGDISKTSYRFVANVYNVKEKRVQILDGPKDLAGRIYAKYERKPALFKRRVYDVTKLPTNPVSYDVDIAEEDAVNTKRLELLDLNEALVDELKRYYGDDLTSVTSGATALDDDDDEDDEDDFDDDEDEGPDVDEMGEMSPKQLKAYAKEVGLSSSKISAAGNRKALIKAIVKKRGY
jgi:hypothetical protein